MAQQSRPGGYIQGYSNHTLATHLRRTAETEAAFLLPHIKKTDRILDVGCGPGTITTGLARHASEGSTIGIDISSVVIEKAKEVAAASGGDAPPTSGPGSVSFEEGDVLAGLRFADASFDAIYTGQTLGHMAPDERLRALVEMRRLLRPGGVLGTRDAAGQHFYPAALGLDRLWVGNLTRAIYKGATPDTDTAGMRMPALLRAAGFDADAGKVHVGAGTQVLAGPDARKWLANRAAGQLKEGDPFRQSWLNAGIPEAEIEETVRAIAAWADTEDAWFTTLQGQMLAWK